MRDPERIDRICELMKEFWHYVPDWRIGQLLVNVCNMTTGFGITDVWWVEDSSFEKCLERLLDEFKREEQVIAEEAKKMKNASVAEPADAADLKSAEETHEGSNPSTGTNTEPLVQLAE